MNRRLYLLGAAVLLVAAALGAFLLGKGRDEGGSAASARDGGALPATSDYHSLLIAPDDADRLTLGTHEGLFTSTDGGRSWTQANLAGQDAMNLAQPDGETIWAAGHDVLARSSDGGETWHDVDPDGLPSLDVHAFAVAANERQTLYAAIAGEGMYRSTDGGTSFALVTREVGRGVMALASLADGRLLAGEMERRALLASGDGGETWERLVDAQILGIAVNRQDPQRILASGPGVLLSTDGGGSWNDVLAIPEGSGPIAWSPSDPQVAYVVGFDRSLHRTDDGGATWTAVVGRVR